MRLRALVCLLVLAVLGVPFAAAAQGPAKVARIGFLLATDRATNPHYLDAFRQGLRDRGWIEGRNIAIEYRFSEGKTERLAALAAELVRLNVDVIVATSTPPARAAQQATRTIPIVTVIASDPVQDGLVASLARPGGNITGLSIVAPELEAKRLQLLKEAIPGASRVAVLQNPGNSSHALRVRETEVAARALKVRLQILAAPDPDEIDRALSAMVKERADALLVLADGMFFLHRRRITDLAARSRLPAMYGVTEHAEAGGLLTYAPNYPDLFRRAAAYADKILKGAKPADLPVEQPTKFELVINRASRES